MASDMQRLQECAAYFQKKSGLSRLLAALRDKIRSYGELGASVTLRACSAEELNAIGGLTGRVYRSGTLRIQIRDLRAALDRSQFSGVVLEELLEQIYGEELISKKEEQAKRRQSREERVEQVRDKYSGTPGERWLSRAFEERAWGYAALVEALAENSDKALNLMEEMVATVNALPVWRAEAELLPVFAAQRTGDPHAFDGEQKRGKLLLHALHCLFGEGEAGGRLAELYLAAGLEPDPLASGTAVLGIRFWREKVEHPAFRAFADRGEPCLAAMANLQGMTSAQSDTGQVFVVENSGVFSALMETALASRVALVCTAGQLRASSWRLLELLCARGQTVHYCGDFDPEGLLIAQRVVARTAGRVKLWGYTRENYERAISDVELSDKRLAMLEQLVQPQLAQAGEWLRRYRRAAYQELLLDRMKEFLNGGCR